MLVILAAYLIGSIPFALILARRWGAADLRRAGSGNLGAANVFRTSGATPGIIVACLDAAKGAASVLLAQRWAVGAEWSAAAGVAAMLGHVFPVWAGFRGGSFAVNSFRGGIHPGFRHHHRFPIAAAAIGFGLGYGAYDYGYGYPYYAGYDDGYYYGDGGCYVVQQRVLTSYGWRVRPVQVCN